MYQVLMISLLLLSVFVAVEIISRKFSRQWFRPLIWLAFAVYILGNLHFTLLSRVPGSGRELALQPFRTYTVLFERVDTDFENAIGFVAEFLKDTSPLVGIILNIQLYWPLGYLLPILFPKLKSKQVILIGCLCSIATEAIQYFLVMGWCETDDVIHNTLGAVIGMWVWHLQANHLKRRAQRRNAKETDG